MGLQRQLFIAVLVSIGFTACQVGPEELEPSFTSTPGAINLSSCEGADVPCLPQPDSCTGPDSDGWSNKPRSADAGPCPPPPSPAGCTQYVIGRHKDVEKYINCPGYNVLNRDDYDQHPGLNDLFISCAACGNATCTPGILIASGDESIPDWSKDGGPWISTELCQLNKYCTVTTNDGGVGSVTNCNCEWLTNSCQPEDAGTPDSGTPDSGTPDSGTPDSGTPDSGTPDSGTPDSGTPDSGTPDSGTPGYGIQDAGMP